MPGSALNNAVAAALERAFADGGAPARQGPGFRRRPQQGELAQPILEAVGD